MLVDMVVPLMRAWGVYIEKEEHYPQGFGWDVKSAIAYLLYKQGHVEKSQDVANMSVGDFWSMPSYYDFWRYLQPYRLAPMFIRFLEKCKCDIYLMTANPNYAHDQMAWITEHFPKYRNRILIGDPKHLAANSKAILIDDCDKNCEDFIAAGGHAILCPRPWNTRWNAPECFKQCGGRRPSQGVIAYDLRAIANHVDTP
jgi:5'(3')-deoxyribonucleotidase